MVDGRAETWFTQFMETNTTTATKCHSCQVEARLFSTDEVTRSAVTRQERNHWSLWGCTCSEESAAEAQAHMDRVTR